MSEHAQRRVQAFVGTQKVVPVVPTVVTEPRVFWRWRSELLTEDDRREMVLALLRFEAMNDAIDEVFGT